MYVELFGLLLGCSPVAGMFNGKPRAGNFREIPVSWEMGGKSLSLGKSRATGISCSSGVSRAMGRSRILKAITISSNVQIAF